MLSALKKPFFTLSPEEASFDRHELECADSKLRSSLEEILRVFIAGYNLTMPARNYELLAHTLENSFDSHHAGFAFEGAGMCLALFDFLFPRRTSRLKRFTDGAAFPHDYIATVGAGFAVARIPFAVRMLNRYLRKLDPLLAWCVFDGYGFHQGFFHHRRFVERQEKPPSVLPPYARQLFDSGLGRSLWWTGGASPARIMSAIERFSVSRQGDLWHGVGVASAYAGGVSETVLLELLQLSGRNRDCLVSGIPFAARMRQKGKNPSPSTDLACRLALGRTANQAADMVAQSLRDITAEWSGTQEELGACGYLLVRQAVRLKVTQAEKYGSLTLQ